MPTRADVLAIRSIEEAFDLSTVAIRPSEVTLIRVALSEGLIVYTLHALDAQEDEMIPDGAVDRVIESGRPASKDIHPMGPRQQGINFEGRIRGPRTIRVKVSWDDCYYIPTVHTIES